jgi:hypothetical protein
MAAVLIGPTTIKTTTTKQTSLEKTNRDANSLITIRKSE